MSFKVHKQLRESQAAIRKDSYTASHIAVLKCLAYRINDTTRVCFPSVQTIADESYLSLRHTRKVLTQLEQDGIIQIIRGSRKSNRYRLMINEAEKIDFVGKSAEAEPVLATGEQVEEAPHLASEAPLTYNSNQSPNPIRDGAFGLLREEQATSSLSLLSETGSQTGVPVRGSNQKSVATSEVTELHALLMRKVRSVCPEPSTRDIKELNEAIEKYGVADLYQTIEGVYRQKNEFWREKLKAATHPCSMLCRSLPTIIEQLNDAEEKASRDAMERYARRADA